MKIDMTQHLYVKFSGIKFHRNIQLFSFYFMWTEQT
jgi:hypothetical protein